MQALDIAIEKWLNIHNSLAKKDSKKHTNNEISNYHALTELLIKELMHYVYYILLNRTPKHIAEDVTSTVLIKIYKALPKFKGDSIAMFKSWVYRVSINVYTDYLRRQRRSKFVWFADVFGKNREHKDNIETSLFDLSHNETAQNDFEIEAKQVLASLKSQERDLIMFRFYYGMNFKEIGEVLGISETAARKRFSRLLRKLKQQKGVSKAKKA